MWQTQPSMASAEEHPVRLLTEQGGCLASTHYMGVATALLFMLLIIYRYSLPARDAREPRFIKPTIPFIGHMVGLARHQVDYFSILHKSQRRDTVTTAATLPMLNGKVYVLWDPRLIHNALRHKDLTFDALSLDFGQRVFGISKLGMEKLWGPDHEIETSVAPPVMHAIKNVMNGPDLRAMGARALKHIARRLNHVDAEDGWSMPNLYRGLRTLMTVATSEGLYGSENPVREDPSLIDALWEFDSNMQPLFLNMAPKLIAPKAYANREKLISALVPWYVDRKDEAPDVAGITKVRASIARDFELPEEEVGRLEAALLFVANTNTIPTLYWFFTEVWLRPDLVAAIRHEVLPLVQLLSDQEGRRTATLHAWQLEARCPLMSSCYREVLRLGAHAIGTRRAIRDTELTDSQGKSHLFKAGVDMMWSVKGLHLATEVWGESSHEFDPERFMEQGKFDKAKKQSYLPFGGGRHLCPGRNFALAENLGFMAALVVGFEVHGLDRANVRMTTALMGDAITKPPTDGEGGSVVVKRRRGWEHVEWRFAS